MALCHQGPCQVSSLLLGAHTVPQLALPQSRSPCLCSQTPAFSVTGPGPYSYRLSLNRLSSGPFSSFRCRLRDVSLASPVHPSSEVPVSSRLTCVHGNHPDEKSSSPLTVWNLCFPCSGGPPAGCCPFLRAWVEMLPRWSSGRPGS